jgi:hypothetical protein
LDLLSDFLGQGRYTALLFFLAAWPKKTLVVMVRVRMRGGKVGFGN